MPSFSPMFGTTFNPGNLTVNGPNSYLYPGQSGVYSSPNGFNYAIFPNVQTGYNALTDYVQRHAQGGAQTVQGFVNGFLGTSTANAANPYPANYAATVSRVSGLNGGGQIGTNYGAIANGIVTAEGNPGAVNAGGTSGGTGLSNCSTADSFNPLNWDCFMFNPANIKRGGDAIAAARNGTATDAQKQAIASTPGGGTVSAAFATADALGKIAGSVDKIAGQIGGVSEAGIIGGLKGPLQRAGYVVLAIVLIAMALAMLAAAGKTITIQQVARGLT